MSEIDGVVLYGGIKRGNREIFIESKDGVRKRYMVSLSKHILVQENDFIRAGEPLSDGAITPNDILAIKGPTAVQEYLVNEIQEVYRLQGVKINDKVLSEAAIRGKRDELLGLKENVIVGHLIPAGTGQRKFNNLIVGSKEEYELLTAEKEAGYKKVREVIK